LEALDVCCEPQVRLRDLLQFVAFNWVLHSLGGTEALGRSVEIRLHEIVVDWHDMPRSHRERHHAEKERDDVIAITKILFADRFRI
jgi:hypothetical protein